MTRFRFSAAATLAAAFSILAPVAAHAGSSTGGALVPSSWACTGTLNGEEVFLLPAVAISPGEGSLIAPFPGFLAPGGVTYLVLAAGTTDSVAWIGRKAGLTGAESTCVLDGTNIEVVIAPAG
jgi:hypothetical protein